VLFAAQHAQTLSGSLFELPLIEFTVSRSLDFLSTKKFIFVLSVGDLIAFAAQAARQNPMLLEIFNVSNTTGSCSNG
jgi:hypothetical protein